MRRLPLLLLPLLLVIAVSCSGDSTETTATTATTTTNTIVEVASEQSEAVTPGNQESICDLFTAEEVTGMVQGAYVAVGITGGESSMLLVEDTLVEGTHGRGDSCDWHAVATSWVILERIQDDQHDAVWSHGEFYQNRDERTFEPDESMPAGVEVANVLVRPGHGGMLWVSIDLQVVEDAPNGGGSTW